MRFLRQAANAADIEVTGFKARKKLFYKITLSMFINAFNNHQPGSHPRNGNFSFVI